MIIIDYSFFSADDDGLLSREELYFGSVWKYNRIVCTSEFGSKYWDNSVCIASVLQKEK